jgi:diguanylate cyclase (GGDEF)-like protein/PAS domain S-box-containing protein
MAGNMHSTLYQRRSEDKVTGQEKALSRQIMSERDIAQRYLDVAGVMIVVLDVNESVTLINRKGCDILEYDNPAEILGIRWIDTFIPLASRDSLRRVFHDFLGGRHQEIEYFENAILTKSGRERVIAWHNIRLTDAAGQPTGVLSSGEDITDRRRAEENLKASETRFREIAENLTEVFWITSADKNQLLYLSPAYEKVWGRSVEEAYLNPRSFMDSIIPADREWVEGRVLEQAVNDYKIEYRITRPDGEVRWIWDRSVPVRNPSGEVCRLIGIAEDITERKQAEETLRSSEERFRKVASTSPDACICIDDGGLVSFWNEAAERIFGFASREMLGRPVEGIIPERLRAAHSAGLKRVANAGHYTGRRIELEARHRDGNEFPVEISLSTWTEGSRRQYGALVRDISERKLQHKELYRLAHYDHLTGLPTRALLWECLRAAFNLKQPTAILLLDIDGLKEINDSAGREAGDKTLVQITARLKSAIPAAATLARLGGDEFAICLPAATPDGISTLIGCVHGSFVEPFSVAGRMTHLGISIGVAIAPSDNILPAELMSNADLALHQAKKADGHALTRFFEPKFREAAHAKQELEIELRRAFKLDEFELYYQPQVRLPCRSIIGLEALVRWKHPINGLRLPGSFIHVLECGPLATPVGDWAIGRACTDGARLHRAGFPLRVGVNLFPEQFRSGRLISTIERALRETGLLPELLELEITERIILADDGTILRTIKELRRLGVKIAFDDFGTGYASLSLLKRYPLDRLKIDRSFVQTLVSDPGDVAIINAILLLGKSFGLEVIAEGVETEGQEATLLRLGCSDAQGYLYCPAVDFSDLQKLLDKQGRCTGHPPSAALLSFENPSPA